MSREDRYIPVSPVLSKDKTGVLYSNGYLKFNVAACLKDLDRSQITDATIVTSGACVVGILVELRTPKIKEIFFLTTERSEYSKFNFIDNNKTKLVCSMEFDRDILPTFQTIHGNVSLIGQEYGTIRVHVDTKFVIRTDTTHIASKGTVTKISPEDNEINVDLFAYTIRASYDPVSEFDDLFDQIDELIDQNKVEASEPAIEVEPIVVSFTPEVPELEKAVSELTHVEVEDTSPKVVPPKITASNLPSVLVANQSRSDIVFYDNLVPRKAYDLQGHVWKDGYFFFNKEVNLFDASEAAIHTKATHKDYELILDPDSLILRRIVVEVEYKGEKEYYVIYTANMEGTKFLQTSSNTTVYEITFIFNWIFSPNFIPLPSPNPVHIFSHIGNIQASFLVGITVDIATAQATSKGAVKIPIEIPGLSMHLFAYQVNLQPIRNFRSYRRSFIPSAVDIKKPDTDSVTVYTEPLNNTPFANLELQRKPLSRVAKIISTPGRTVKLPEIAVSKSSSWPADTHIWIKRLMVYPSSMIMSFSMLVWIVKNYYFLQYIASLPEMVVMLHRYAESQEKKVSADVLMADRIMRQLASAVVKYLRLDPKLLDKLDRLMVNHKLASASVITEGKMEASEDQPSEPPFRWPVQVEYLDTTGKGLTERQYTAWKKIMAKGAECWTPATKEELIHSLSERRSSMSGIFSYIYDSLDHKCTYAALSKYAEDNKIPKTTIFNVVQKSVNYSVLIDHRYTYETWCYLPKTNEPLAHLFHSSFAKLETVRDRQLQSIFRRSKQHIDFLQSVRLFAPSDSEIIYDDAFYTDLKKYDITESDFQALLEYALKYHYVKWLHTKTKTTMTDERIRYYNIARDNFPLNGSEAPSALLILGYLHEHQDGWVNMQELVDVIDNNLSSVKLCIAALADRGYITFNIINTDLVKLEPVCQNQYSVAYLTKNQKVILHEIVDHYRSCTTKWIPFIDLANGLSANTVRAYIPDYILRNYAISAPSRSKTAQSYLDFAFTDEFLGWYVSQH